MGLALEVYRFWRVAICAIDGSGKGTLISPAGSFAEHLVSSHILCPPVKIAASSPALQRTGIGTPTVLRAILLVVHGHRICTYSAVMQWC